MRGRGRVLVGVLALAVVVLVAAGGFLAWQSAHRTAYERAVGALPGDTLRATYTDWAGVRARVGGSSLGADSGDAEVEGFLDRAYEKDLSATSAIDGSTRVLARRFGFSPLTAAWEIYGQSREGQVVVLRLPDGADPEGIEQNLRDLGYDEPDESGGVWRGGPALVSRIDPTLTPVEQYVAVEPDDGLVLMSDRPGYLAKAGKVVRGDAESLADVDHVGDLVGVDRPPLSSVLFARDFACEALSMSEADPRDQRVAERLVDRAGGVSPVAGMVMSLEPDRSMTVGMAFESSDQAEDNAEPRARLASGDAPGQGGSFGDRFTVAAARTSGDLVVLDLDPVDDEQYLVSDLSEGTLLFATC